MFEKTETQHQRNYIQNILVLLMYEIMLMSIEHQLHCV